MNCKQTVKSIQGFINDELSTEELREFINHIENCSECKEELTIEVLVKEGTKHLETGNVFDLNKELDLRLKSADRKLKRREKFELFYYCIIALIVIAIVIIVLLIVMI